MYSCSNKMIIFLIFLMSYIYILSFKCHQYTVLNHVKGGGYFFNLVLRGNKSKMTDGTQNIMYAYRYINNLVRKLEIISLFTIH